jgi:glycosyltransferase involved in cell wall biosynthesis
MNKKKDLLVSVSCLTYNHGDYIEESLEGILMQKTDFCFEVLIHDDASTDDTIKIIKRYQKEYPNVIKPIFQQKNKHSMGQRGMNIKYNLSRAKGRYIALCEGDDYWTDPLKLQKQIDFLEENPSYAVSFHDVDIAFENETCSYFKKYHPFLDGVNTVYFKDFLKQNFHIPTCSCIFRKDKVNPPPFAERMNYEDFILFSCALVNSKAYVHYDQMGVYRKNNPGSVTNNKALFDAIRIKADYIEFLTWLQKQANDTDRQFIVDRIFTEVQTIRQKVEMYKGSKFFSLYSKFQKFI